MIKRALSVLATAALLLWAFAELHELPAQTVTPSLGIYSTVPRGQLPGTTTTDSASAGNIGEYLTANRPVGSASSLTTATALSLANIAITAGDWQVSGAACFSTTATTTVNVFIAYINTSLNALGSLSEYNESRVKFNGLVLQAGDTCLSVPMQRVSLASTTTYYINAYADFGVSTVTAYGQLQAWRVR